MQAGMARGRLCCVVPRLGECVLSGETAFCFVSYRIRNETLGRIFVRMATVAVCVCPLSAMAADNGEILIKLRDEGHFAATLGRPLGHGVYVLGDGNGVRAGAASSSSVMAEWLVRLRADPTVLYAEPNYLGRFADVPAAADRPNDPEYLQQDWLEAVGARQAWAVATGQGVTVAVVDSGVDLMHPDLLDNLLGEGFSTGDNAIGAQDRLGHGTFVAGIIAARRANTVAGSGLAPDARLLPIKISRGYAAGFSAATLAQGIDYATEHGAQIINLSLYLDQASQTVGDAVQRALDAGIVVVAAAGNEGGRVSFPATYPGVIAVAGAGADGALLANSNSGPEVAVAAYGGGVTSTTLRGEFGTYGTGTSFAAPMVAATAAHLLQIDRRMDGRLVAEVVKAYARPLLPASSGNNTSPAYGLLDAGKAVLALLPDLCPRLEGTNLHVAYSLPPTAGAVDVHVRAVTPLGEINLRSNGAWEPVDINTLVPVAAGYRAFASASGVLFGDSGLFAGIDLSGMPDGEYDLTIGLTVAGTGTSVGPVSTSRLHYAPTGVLD